MKQRAWGAVLVTIAMVVGVGVSVSVVGESAEASTGLVEVVVEYTDSNVSGVLEVSPDGTVVVIPIFGPVSDFGLPDIEGVRLVDLTDPARDQTLMFPLALRFEGELPVVFSADSSMLYVRTEIEIIVIDTSTFEIQGGLPINTGFGPSSGYSPTFEYTYFWESPPPGEANPVLFVVRTGEFDPLYEGSAVFGEVRFSRDGQRIFLPQPSGLLTISLPGGEDTLINFQGSVTLGVAAGVEQENATGDVVVVALTERPGFTLTGRAVVDIPSGQVLTEIPAPDANTASRVGAVSPDGRFLLFEENSFSETEGFGPRSLHVYSVDTGQKQLWEEPLLERGSTFNIFPLSASNQSVWFVESPELLVTFDWEGPAVVSESIFAPPPGDAFSWSPLRHIRATDELVVVASSQNDDNFDYGEWPDRPPSGTIITTYFFDRISLIGSGEFSIPGSALGFDQSGTIAVSYDTLSISVWDLASQTKSAQFPVTVFEEDFDYPRLVSSYPELPLDSELFVSADGQRLYFVAIQLDVNYEGGESFGDVAIWSMSTQTGEFTRVAFFEDTSARTISYNQQEETLLLGMTPFDAEWDIPAQILSVSLPSGDTTELFSTQFPQPGLIDIGDGHFAMFGQEQVTLVDGANGQQGPSLEFPRSLTSPRVSIASGAGVAAAVARNVEFLPSGDVEDLGGAVAMGSLPSVSDTTDSLARMIYEWEGSGSAAGVFSPDGQTLYLVTNTELRAFDVPGGEPVQLPQVNLPFSDSFTVHTALLAPDGQTLWVGVGASFPTVFYPVTLPQAAGVTEDGGEVSAAGTMPFDMPQWFIPGLLLAGSVVLVAGWLLRRPGSHKTTPGGRSKA